ncbi:MAG: 16S rRNA (guanine(527)-N(7))-methyltransferase RsmG [Desulfurivibrionaceae bacterium]|nr:16S rRNA (guanine(527)-N(7))-methyltransferase RsmG [Desulfurivibrionaceae bacterium]
MNQSELFRRGLAGLGLELAEPAIEQLRAYLAELQKWNRRINLVAKAPPETLIEIHFFDSLTLLPLVQGCPEPGLMDIGSGAGFPGLVLKIACPELPVILVEPRRKRAGFMRQVIRTLKLKGVTVLESRLERDNPALAGLQNAMPIITSRAFASVHLFLELVAPFSAPAGRVICMKGRKAAAEIAEWQQLSPASPFRLTETIETVLPFSAVPRKLLLFTKRPSREGGLPL